jgi:hypothetical protein
MFFEFGQRNQRSDRQAFGIERQAVQSTNVFQIHQTRRSRCVVFHCGQEVLTARNRSWRFIDIARGSSIEQLNGFSNARRVGPLEGFHMIILFNLRAVWPQMFTGHSDSFFNF